jgi:putative ABC transport system permease protein
VPFYLVQAGYFETMNIPLVRGRAFNEHDQRDSVPVVVVTESLAKRYFANEDPIGRQIWIGASEGPARTRYQTREIVGVVGDIRTSDIAQSPQPSFYVPQPQLMWSPPTLVIRTSGDADAVTAAIRKTLLSLDADAPLHDVRTMNDYLALDLGRARFQTVLFAVFASLALLLTAIGLYGVVSYAVVQRMHEFGVRMALGASPRDLFCIVLRRGLALTCAGIAAGVLGALGLARFIASVLYGISSHDPITYVVVSIVLAGVALLASYVPARRAARVDPMVALRYE